MNFAELRAVNAAVNEIPFVDEIDEDWSPITAEGGDCDSYATAKYQRLVALDWPKSALRLATCWVENNGGYHAVLLVDFEGRTWVLDNRYPHPTEYEFLPYRWHLLQIAGTQKWENA